MKKIKLLFVLFALTAGFMSFGNADVSVGYADNEAGVRADPLMKMQGTEEKKVRADYDMESEYLAGEDDDDDDDDEDEDEND